ncbi:PREDICTED: uncharacterized protein LOC109585504 [Amphimedon queenslandica]|uniref:C-terminal of Roc (COR) domain-containing protein n=1 Tax=Amphimedon queenslandica TaxID=400682 RepID=A0A1X7TXC7_AMPQE|nr:PREDICTED: uncharacterized protein LOC109585504 [Amphimedon queenslandica]|eukprot:XP_019857177.1 PREDICTED: uncharacterized protein LOC109585504 [Amphimedon queenslandica]
MEDPEEYQSPVEESRPDGPGTVPAQYQYVAGPDSLLPEGRSTSTSSVLPELEADSIIDAVTLRRIMKNRNVKIIPLLICSAGLPESAKKEALQEIFKTPITAGFSSHHILATNRSNYEIACVYSTSMLYNFGVQSCQLIRSSEGISYKISTDQPSIYKDTLLNKHMKELLAHLHKYCIQFCDKQELEFVFTVTRGAALINIWNITLNTNVFYFLRAFSGHLTNSRMWLFADLTIEEVNEEEGKLQIWQKPLDYLLRCMRLCKGVTTHKRPCTVFASHSGEDSDKEIETKMKTFEEELQRVARQLNVTEFVDQTLPFNKKTQGNYFLLFLKNLVGSVYGKTRIPISGLFLRGALEHKESMFMRKAGLRQLAEECDMNDEDFKEFCELFTSFGSIFDLSLVNDTSDIIIVKPNEFLSNLNKAFDNPPDSKMYNESGIITKTAAREMFGASQGETFMSVLALVGMVAVVPGGKYAEDETHEVCYYMPCARKRKQERFMDKEAVRLLLNNRSPINFVNFEVAFTNCMLKHSFAQLQLSTAENRTIIKCTDNSSIITMTYRGDEIEVKVMPPSKKHTLCVVQAFKEIAEIIDKKKGRGRFSYAFAIMCSKNEKEYHRLPHDVKLCDECKSKAEYSDWIEALTEEPIPEKFKFVTDIEFDDVIFVTKELVACCDQEMLTDLFKTCFDADYKESLPPWLNVLNQLTKWITQDLSNVPNSSATKAELAAKLDKWSNSKPDEIKALVKTLHKFIQ